MSKCRCLCFQASYRSAVCNVKHGRWFMYVTESAMNHEDRFETDFLIFKSELVKGNLHGRNPKHARIRQEAIDPRRACCSHKPVACVNAYAVFTSSGTTTPSSFNSIRSCNLKPRNKALKGTSMLCRGHPPVNLEPFTHL